MTSNRPDTPKHADLSAAAGTDTVGGNEDALETLAQLQSATQTGPRPHPVLERLSKSRVTQWLGRLLLPRGDNKAGFYHFTFQDFLAARRLADIQRERVFEVLCERADTAAWRGPLSFLVASELANSRVYNVFCWLLCILIIGLDLVLLARSIFPGPA